jgi:hypothetical protein
MTVQAHTGLKAADHEIYLRYFDEGEKFDRAFRVSILPPNEANPLKFAIGYMEIPKDRSAGGPWFYPVKIRLDQTEDLLDVIHILCSVYVAIRKTKARLDTPYLVDNLLRGALSPDIIGGRADRIFVQLTYHSEGL